MTRVHPPEWLGEDKLLHLALESDWFDALAAGCYPVSTRGATVDEVGFLHACRDMAQLHGVVAHFYDDTTAPLVVDPDLLLAGYEVRHESDPGSPGGHLPACVRR